MKQFVQLGLVAFAALVFVASSAAASPAELRCYNSTTSSWGACTTANPVPVAVPVDTCGTPGVSVLPGQLTIDPTGAICTNASVASGTFDDTMTAIATLPTLIAGTQRPRGSLGGAYYSQPVYGSATGGGTQVDATHGLPIGLVSPYPTGAAALTASATGTTGVTVATLAGTSGKTTYVCGFSITSDATAGLAGAATVTGTVSGTLNYLQGVAIAPAVTATTQNFAPCIPASAANTAIAVNSAAAGTGGSTAVSAWGYQL